MDQAGKDRVAATAAPAATVAAAIAAFVASAANVAIAALASQAGKDRVAATAAPAATAAAAIVAIMALAVNVAIAASSIGSLTVLNVHEEFQMKAVKGSPHIPQWMLLSLKALQPQSFYSSQNPFRYDVFRSFWDLHVVSIIDDLAYQRSYSPLSLWNRLALNRARP